MLHKNNYFYILCKISFFKEFGALTKVGSGHGFGCPHK